MVRGYPLISLYITKEKGEKTMMNEKMFRKIERLVATIGGKYFTVEVNEMNISISIFNNSWYEIFRSVSYLYNKLILTPVETSKTKKFILVDDFCGLDIMKWDITITIVDNFLQFPKAIINTISKKDFEDYFIGD